MRHRQSDDAISPISAISGDPGHRHSQQAALEVVQNIEPVIHTLLESSTDTHQYIVADPTTRDAVIINPVLDRAPRGSAIATTAADHILFLVQQYRYNVVRILETHSVTDHATSAWYLRSQLRDAQGRMPRICTGKAIAGVQRMFARQYRLTAEWNHFDAFQDGQVFLVGNMKVQVIHLLSQPDWFAFAIGQNVFAGQKIPHGDDLRPTEQVLLRKLAFYQNSGHAFHPPNKQDVSRPPTSQTDVSEWMHEPEVPRTSINSRPVPLADLGCASPQSSPSSHQRWSQIPELA